MPFHAGLLRSLRETALIASTHFSTQIEGNRLTLPEVGAVLKGAKFPGRERDEQEVRNYYRALTFMEECAEKADPLSEKEIQTLHGLVMDGRRRPTPYRNQQNVIRDSATRRIVYLPPEANDVPILMAQLVAFVNAKLAEGQLPVPVLAGLAHYQFATIHPYLDGNGRTARLLTTLILRRAGYGLRGIYSLDEHYARDLNAYYAALTVGSHNYYDGRAEADLTRFVTYFCNGMADAFTAIRRAAIRLAAETPADHAELLRGIDPRQRRLLPLFQAQGSATSAEMAAHLKMSQRTLVELSRAWIATGFLEYQNPSRKIRSYRLGEKYVVLL